METVRAITLDYSKILLGETSEKIIEVIIEIIYLTYMKNYLEEPHGMPPPENFDSIYC